MKKHLSLLAVTLLTAGLVQAQATWTVLIPESEITAVAGGTNTNLNALGMDPNNPNVFVAGNLEGTNRKILKFDLSQPPGSRVSVVATDVALVTAIGAANGANPDPPASAVRFQALGFNANGKILAYLDGSGMQAALLAIEPIPPYTINVLCCETTSPTSPIEGGNGMVVQGNTAYLLCDGGFGNPNGDCIMSVDTSTLVNDGSKPATVLVTEATLTAASGDTAANQSINDIEFLNATQAVAINSGAAASNDDLIRVDFSSNSAIKYVLATDIEADLGPPTTDVGYNSVTVDSAGRVYLANMFGAPTNAGADDGVLILSNIVPPNADTALQSEAQIVSEAGGSDAFIGSDGLVFDASTGRVYAASDGTGNSGLIAKKFTPAAAVGDWSIY
ncbi:MAG: hypothetical protein N2111_08485 [Candidatus Sumerlaeaceae bacterium]|nr:hypothetical protein [Candidatus Sumerlaeaceae bacterium]